MTSKIENDESDLIRECANSPFENLVILALKEFRKTIYDHGQRISALEKK